MVFDFFVNNHFFIIIFERTGYYSSNGSRAFKNYNKKVIIDKEIKYYRYVRYQRRMLEFLDWFPVGLVQGSMLQKGCQTGSW